MSRYILITSIVFSIIEWIGEFKKSNRVIYFTKPVVIILLIFWTILQIDFSTLNIYEYSFPVVWFIVGLFFCLLGDIFLMLASKFFLAGLGSFLFGQIFYLLGFGKLTPPDYNYLPGIIIFIIIFLVSHSVYKKIRVSLIASSNGKMIIPVTLYSIVISLMLYAAVTTLIDREWYYVSALLVSLGALSFYLSDIVNAWDRFVEYIPLGHLFVMVMYHIGQLAIIIGAVLHYVYPIDT
jgi:uncharacterized membrane protein YhhN